MTVVPEVPGNATFATFGEQRESNMRKLSYVRPPWKVVFMNGEITSHPGRDLKFIE